MSLLIVCPERNMSRWVAALRRLDPTLAVEVWPEVADPAAVEFALCWNQPPDLLGRFPNLKCVSSLGAGVNHLLGDPALPPQVPIVRLVDEGLKQSMAEYVLHGVLDHFRRFADYRRQQLRGEWQPHHVPAIAEVGVGILGCGVLGAYVGGKLQACGFPVHGWSRTPKTGGAIPVFAGETALDAFLARSRVLVCLLPLTAATENLLAAPLFSRLPPGAYLINVARGRLLVEADLLAALASGSLSGALLDVLRDEPPAADHPFWHHPRITLTPHIAAVTDPDSAVAQVLDNYRRALAGEPLLHPVDRARGY